MKSIYLYSTDLHGLVMVIGGQLYSDSCVYDPQHYNLDWTFFTLICCKNCNVFFLKNENETGMAL